MAVASAAMVKAGFNRGGSLPRPPAPTDNPLDCNLVETNERHARVD